MGRKKKNLSVETKPVVEEQVKAEEVKPVEPIKITPTQPTVEMGIAHFESMLAVSRANFISRISYDDAQVQSFILQNGLHGKVLRIVSDASYAPVNGNYVTKFGIFFKK